MSAILLLVLSATVTQGLFGLNVRLDHEDDPHRGCGYPVITLGPGKGSNQTVYVAFEDDSLHLISDLMFQKSTNAGRTWMPADVLIRRGCPGVWDADIATDSDGNIFVVFCEYDRDSVWGHYDCCVKSTDGGATWSSPARVNDSICDGIGWARIAADSAGNLFCAWNDWRTGYGRIWSSVSTDRGTTWSQNVRVDDVADSVWNDCAQADVFVQPGTNQYLVAAEAPCPDGHLGCYLYRSTDRGQTFQPGVRLDTFGGYAGEPHVVADAQHIVCDYVDGWAEARVLYTQPDTWGIPRFVGYSYRGPTLAMSADGCVHAAMTCHKDDGPWHVYYATAAVPGDTWSTPELVSIDTTHELDVPDIRADSAGHAYVTWMTTSTQNSEIWFATNNPAAIAEQPVQQLVDVQPSATIVRRVLFLAERPSSSPSASYLLDISGRQVVALKPGANDVSRLSPGVYFIREGLGIRGEGPGKTRKIVVTR